LAAIFPAPPCTDRMKKAILLLLLFVSTLHAEELGGIEREQLLERLRRLHKQSPSFQAEFREERTSELLTRPIINEGEIALKAPDKFRREIHGTNRSVTVSNGQVLWIYYPNFNQAELYRLGQRDFFDRSISAFTAGLNFHRIDELYDVEASREGNMYQLHLTPKRASLRRMIRRIVISLDDQLLVHRTDVTLGKREQIITEYKNPRRVPLPDSLFEFTPPPDAHVSEPLARGQ
jgi:outer membrane lipoprotein-sorting protein